METVEHDRNGLCGFDRFSFLQMNEAEPVEHYREFPRGQFAALKAILEAEKKAEYENVNFSDYLDLFVHKDIGMTRGEHLFRLFAGKLPGKQGGDLYIYVVLRVEAKPGRVLEHKLFARSYPVGEAIPGRWMNRREPWQYIDESVIHERVVETTI